MRLGRWDVVANNLLLCRKSQNHACSAGGQGSEWASAIANKAKAFENHIWDTTIVTNCYHIKAAAAAGWLRSWHFVLDVLLLQKNVHFVVTRIIFYTFLAANAVFDAIGDTRRRLIFSINKKRGHCMNIFYKKLWFEKHIRIYSYRFLSKCQ